MTNQIWTPQEVEKILNSDSILREEKIKVIDEYFQAQIDEINKEYNMFVAKEWGIFLLDLGMVAIPLGGVEKAGYKIVEKFGKCKFTKKIITKLDEHILKTKAYKHFVESVNKYRDKLFRKSKIGRKFVQDISNGVIVGGFSGMFIGLSEGLINDEKYLWSTISGAITGMIGGGLLGGAGAYVERFMAAKKLKGYNFKTNADIDCIGEELKKQYRKDVKEFYQRYIQDIVLVKDGKKIPFTGKALEEQMKHNPKQGQNFPDLISDIKNAKKPEYSPNIKPEEKPDISHYDVYRGKNGDHYVEISKNKDSRFYITKDDIPKRTTQDTSLDTSKDVSISNATATKVQNASDNNTIITTISSDVNANSGNNLNNIQVLKGHVEKNVDYNNEYAAASEENKEPEINPEYLKPIELEEDGMATGGAAGISDKFVNPNVYNRDSVEYPETSLGDEELPMPSAKNKFDFFENSMKELMKHQRSFRYDAKGGKEYSISTISRKLDEITKTLDGIQKQLDYHEKVVNIYNTPELAEFYLNRPVRNIMKSVFEDYCLMEGIEITR